MWQLDDIHELLEADEVLTCIRQGRAVDGDVTYVDGLPTATHAAATFEIVCTIQPMGGRDLMLVPEAFRVKDMLSCWQAHRTPMQDVVRLDVGDVVLFRGRAYQVQGAEDWESYTKATLCGIDVGSYDGVIDPNNLPALYPATPTPPPEPTPQPTEELDMDVGPLVLQMYIGPGNIQDFRIPGHGDTTLRYRMPRAGKVTGYSFTGDGDNVKMGAYLTRRDVVTGITSDARFVDPESQPPYEASAGAQVIFDEPLACAQGDIVVLKIKMRNGTPGFVDLVAFLQITLDAAPLA